MSLKRIIHNLLVVDVFNLVKCFKIFVIPSSGDFNFVKLHTKT